MINLTGIEPGSPVPLYEQIAERIRMSIATGDLRAGDPLPSVRHLAAQIRVNPATVVQAYRALQGDGLAEMRQGSGTFVRPVTPKRQQAERARIARRMVRELLEQSARVGLNKDDIAAAFASEAP